MKILDGRELADFVKERQAQTVRRLRHEKKTPKLVIIRDNDHPVISKYVNLKCQYGEDINVLVEDVLVEGGAEELKNVVRAANLDESVSGIIVQLPLKNPEWTEEVVAEIDPKKDVDGLSEKGRFDSATATAINWLLAGHNVDLSMKNIAIVGRGKLVGRPLIKMWQNSGYSVEVFGRDSDLVKLANFDVIVTATGVPHLIKDEMVRSGCVVVDAGTASEDGVIVGDLDDNIRKRKDLSAITPKIGGVGPLTVAVLFENVIMAETEKKQ